MLYLKNPFQMLPCPLSAKGIERIYCYAWNMAKERFTVFFFTTAKSTMQIQSLSMDILTVKTRPASYVQCLGLLFTALLSLSAHLAKKTKN